MDTDQAYQNINLTKFQSFHNLVGLGLPDQIYYTKLTRMLTLSLRQLKVIELTFFAVNPDIKSQGNEVERGNCCLKRKRNQRCVFVESLAQVVWQRKLCKLKRIFQARKSNLDF